MRVHSTPMGAGAEDPSSIEFGRFRVDRRARQLLADGHPVELGGRAFDTLLVLIDGRGEVISKDDLLGRIWPDRVVEENNLEIQISTLRKVFGPDRDLIRTVAHRGYQFTGEVRAVDAPGGATAASPATNLPVPVSELIGREAETREVMSLVTAHRLVTLIGAGGIGKTRLGLEAARRLRPAFPDGVFLADLAPVTTGDRVAVTVAATLNLPMVADGARPERIGAALGARQLLLLLDNCEHVVETAARVAQGMLSASPSAVLLTTSREPLRIEGEHVYRVPPLALPPEHANADEILRHDAARLFVTRALAAGPGFVPDPDSVSAVGAICRRLDGMPLAIELAAARVPALGAAGVAARLDDRFMLLTSGNRTALPRQQTLLATLDWSYELLSERERIVLRRLAVFAGAFALDAATHVVSGLGLSPADVVDTLADLVSKSLVSADLKGPTRYRLRETMRAYALEKLIETGEFHRFARRHADYHIAAVQSVDLHWRSSPPSDWLGMYGAHIHNVRVALDWAFSPGGDATVGVTLTAATVPLWMYLALTSECRARVQQAVEYLEHDVAPDPRRDVGLFLALGLSILHSSDVGSATMVASLTRAFALAERLGDIQHRMQAMFGLYVHRLVTGDLRGALSFAEGLRTVSATLGDPVEALIGGRFVGTMLHLLGDQPGARQHIEPLITVDFETSRLQYIVRYQWDQRVVTRALYARVLWLQGFVDKARRIADEAVAYADTIGHVPSSLYALSQAACPVVLWTGDLAAAERYVRAIADLAVKHALDAWGVWGRLLDGVLLLRRGKCVEGVELMETAFRALPESAFHIQLNFFRAELAEGLAGSGQIERGLSVLEDTLARAQRTEEGWYLAELLRKKGELALRRDAAAVAEAEACFVQASDVAHRQGALSWELRAAMSLARLYQRQGRDPQARRTLAPIYRRFTEGFGTPDLVAAKTLVEPDTLRPRSPRRAP